MKTKVSGIYAITNQVNGKVYIGKSISIGRRWKEHKYELRYNKHCNEYLQNAWNKYGEENFSFEIVEECDEHVLPLKEVEWINTFGTFNRDIGYNLREEEYERIVSEETKQILRVKAVETYNRLIKEGYYTCILYNLNNNSQIEYNTPQEAKANSSIPQHKTQNFKTGEVCILKRLFTQSRLNSIIHNYKKYKEVEYRNSTKSDTIYVVNAYNFTDIKLFPSKTNACVTMFGSGNETDRISKVIDTNNKFRWHYFFSSEESMNTILPTCHKVCTRVEYNKSESIYKYILNHPDNPPIYLYKGVDAINHIPNATKKGIQKLMSGERSHYYKYTLEKISTGVEEIYS